MVILLAQYSVILYVGKRDDAGARGGSEWEGQRARARTSIYRGEMNRMSKANGRGIKNSANARMDESARARYLHLYLYRWRWRRYSLDAVIFLRSQDNRGRHPNTDCFLSLI